MADRSLIETPRRPTGRLHGGFFNGAGKSGHGSFDYPYQDDVLDRPRGGDRTAQKKDG